MRTRSRPIRRFLSLQRLRGASATDGRVRQILVEKLYAQPSGVTIGSICGIFCAWGAAAESSNSALPAYAAIMTVVAAARIVMAFLLPRLKNFDTKALEFCYELGAFTYAAVSGMIAAESFRSDLPSSVQTLTVTYAVAYGVAMASRNAGRPAIATGQIFLSIAPVIVVCALSDSTAFHILAFTLALLLPAMISIMKSIFETMRDHIAAAETSARLAEKMQVLARTDVVTGLLNRAGLNHELAERLSNLEGPDKLALFWLDLDRFKEVNDSLGHQVGDRLLAEIARRLRRVAPETATVARFGGDEFIVACSASERREVEALALQIMDEISRPARIDDHRLEVGTSMGISILPDDGHDLETLLQGADLALYHSKVNGRKQVNFFDPSMTRELVRRREIEAELRLALQRNELSIFFQPIVDLEAGKIRAFEALVRWFHPEKGELHPDEFIPVAEETGAIITLGNWITAQAAKAAAQWPEDVTLAVNLSPLQIKAPGAALGILNALREARLDPSRLELEITETVLLDDSQATENFISELANAGVRFALDDFGTGYSSLGYLNKYPFSKIKVDRSFVSGINQGKKSDAIIRAVSGMGQTLGMAIVAEGLETIEQVQAVREAGCTLGQGYYFSRAVPAYQAAMLLSKERAGEKADNVARLAG